MKKLLSASLLLLIVFLFIATKSAKAQDASTDPGAYMSAISNAETGMNKIYMAYISASAHSSRKRKIEKLREKTVESILTCQSTLNYMSPYQNDNSLRQSSLSYVDLCYKVFNEDYAHIVNMEDIAERTYDEMQAYLLLQQATNDTLQMAIKRMNIAEKSFASKYHVNLVEEKTELDDKMEETNRLSAYRDKVFLLFYKCNWEDNQLTEAVNQKNVTKIEQTRSALGKYAKEGLAVLDTLHSFENDASLIVACKNALDFYRNEAEAQISKVTDYFLKEESFNKLKTAMDDKPDNQRTQQDVDIYNKAVADINNAVNISNQTNNDLNSGRNEVNNNWGNAEKQFLDTHTPYYK